MTETTRPSEWRSSRRAVLAAAAGGLGAWAASALGRAAPAQAANGDPLILGGASNETSQTTYVQSTTANLTVFEAFSGNSDGSGVALLGESYGVTGIGVRGFSPSWRAVMGLTNTGRGVHGESTSGWGVYGRSSSNHGVHGAGTVGVHGESSAGTGVEGISTNGYAIRGSGRVRFDKISGVASIPAGATSVTITPGVDVTSDSFVLLTAKSNIGSRSLYYSTDATNNRFTVRLSSSRSSSTTVAWLLLR